MRKFTAILLSGILTASNTAVFAADKQGMEQYANELENLTAQCEDLGYNPEYEKKELILSGMKIGGSILSSTVNTLFFIFAGEYLILFINFSMYYSLEVMINSREFAEGIINIIISAVGCIAIIPAASCLAAYRFSKKTI